METLYLKESEIGIYAHDTGEGRNRDRLINLILVYGIKSKDDKDTL